MVLLVILHRVNNEMGSEVEHRALQQNMVT